MNKLSYFLMMICILLASTSLFAQINFTKLLLDGNFARANGVVSADVEGDGDMDIIGSAIDVNTIAWWENNGSQAFTRHIIDGNFSGALSVQAADIDGDGNIDISAAAWFGNETAWWQNDGNQNFTKHIIDSLVETSVYTKDVNGDGHMDFLGASFIDSSISWYTNNGNQNFTKHQIEANYLFPFDAIPIDIDGDSDVDLVASSGDENTIDWWENDGDQNFAKYNIANNLNGPRHLYVADVNSDNDLDILGTQGPEHDFSWWENDGSQTFTKHLLDNSIGSAFDIHSADLDDDGDMDIIGASIGPIGILAVWLNDGNENFTKTVIDGNFPGANCVITADVDADGDLDILATAEFGNGQIAWYENTSPSMLGDWTVQNSGIPTDNQIVLAAVNENVCWGVTRDPGASYVTRTTDGGSTWVASNLVSLNFFFSIASLSADTAWIAANGSIYNTTDGGLNWTEQLTTSGFIFVVRFFDSNNGVCIGDGNGVDAEIYTTANGGNNWTQVPSSNIPSLQSEGFIPANSWVVDNTIWAPTNGGSLYKSKDRGLTWYKTRGVVNIGGSYCAFKDTMNGLLCGSLAQVVKRTTDGGATWDSTESKPEGISTLFMSYIPGTNASYMICASPPHGPLPGSAYTLDNGVTWKEVDSVNHQRAVFVSPSLGWSWGGANVIYKWTGGSLIPTSVENTNEVVQDIHLEQNYPNPFNPSTKISWQSPVGSWQTIKVFDVLGNEVATLVDEYKQAGRYEVEFNAEKLPSGVYFYRLNAGSFVQTRKMLLLK